MAEADDSSALRLGGAGNNGTASTATAPTRTLLSQPHELSLHSTIPSFLRLLDSDFVHVRITSLHD